MSAILSWFNPFSYSIFQRSPQRSLPSSDRDTSDVRFPGEESLPPTVPIDTFLQQNPIGDIPAPVIESLPAPVRQSREGFFSKAWTGCKNFGQGCWDFAKGFVPASPRSRLYWAGLGTSMLPATYFLGSLGLMAYPWISIPALLGSYYLYNQGVRGTQSLVSNIGSNIIGRTGSLWNRARTIPVEAGNGIANGLGGLLQGTRGLASAGWHGLTGLPCRLFRRSPQPQSATSTPIQTSTNPEPSRASSAVSLIGNTAGGAAIGAAVGSVVPVLGTVIGAGVGATAVLATKAAGVIQRFFRKHRQSTEETPSRVLTPQQHPSTNPFDDELHASTNPFDEDVAALAPMPAEISEPSTTRRILSGAINAPGRLLGGVRSAAGWVLEHARRPKTTSPAKAEFKPSYEPPEGFIELFNPDIPMPAPTPATSKSTPSRGLLGTALGAIGAVASAIVGLHPSIQNNDVPISPNLAGVSSELSAASDEVPQKTVQAPAPTVVLLSKEDLDAGIGTSSTLSSEEKAQLKQELESMQFEREFPQFITEFEKCLETKITQENAEQISANIQRLLGKIHQLIKMTKNTDKLEQIDSMRIQLREYSGILSSLVQEISNGKALSMIVSSTKKYMIGLPPERQDNINVLITQAKEKFKQQVLMKIQSRLNQENLTEQGFSEIVDDIEAVFSEFSPSEQQDIARQLKQTDDKFSKKHRGLYWSPVRYDRSKDARLSSVKRNKAFYEKYMSLANPRTASELEDAPPPIADQPSLQPAASLHSKEKSEQEAMAQEDNAGHFQQVKELSEQLARQATESVRPVLEALRIQQAEERKAMIQKEKAGQLQEKQEAEQVRTQREQEEKAARIQAARTLDVREMIKHSHKIEFIDRKIKDLDTLESMTELNRNLSELSRWNAQEQDLAVKEALAKAIGLYESRARELQQKSVIGLVSRSQHAENSSQPPVSGLCLDKKGLTLAQAQLLAAPPSLNPEKEVSQSAEQSDIIVIEDDEEDDKFVTPQSPSPSPVASSPVVQSTQLKQESQTQATRILDTERLIREEALRSRSTLVAPQVPSTMTPMPTIISVPASNTRIYDSILTILASTTPESIGVKGTTDFEGTIKFIEEKKDQFTTEQQKEIVQKLLTFSQARLDQKKLTEKEFSRVVDYIETVFGEFTDPPEAIVTQLKQVDNRFRNTYKNPNARIGGYWSPIEYDQSKIKWNGKYQERPQKFIDKYTRLAVAT